jgi:hypothetical protein
MAQLGSKRLGLAGSANLSRAVATLLGATAVHEARINLRQHSNNANCDHSDDSGDDGLSKDPEDPGEPLHIVNTMLELLTCIQPIAPLSGALQRHRNYFELVSSLKLGIHPRAPLPFRTDMHGNMAAVHLSLSKKGSQAKVNLKSQSTAFSQTLVSQSVKVSR